MLINEFIIKEQIIDVVAQSLAYYMDCFNRLDPSDVPYVLDAIKLRLDKILINE